MTEVKSIEMGHKPPRNGNPGIVPPWLKQQIEEVFYTRIIENDDDVYEAEAVVVE